MNRSLAYPLVSGILALVAVAPFASAQTADTAQPYRVLRTDKIGGAGGWDYVFADADGRRLYIPRGDRVTIYDLDTLAPIGVIPGTKSVHGVAVDTKTHHAFSSSQPIVMWDTQTLAVIKTIAVQGRPDGILFEPATERVYILSHVAPNVTVIDAVDGSVVGTIDLGGAPEQGASDGQGHVYIDVEDKDNVAVVDANSLAVTAHYALGGLGGGPGGLSLDAKNHILFACCHNPATVVILGADDGKIITSLPIGTGVDAAEFNPNTMEAFSSQRDGTLTVVKENSPTAFEVEQTVSTRDGARTSTLDTGTNQIFLITADRMPAAPKPATPPPAIPAAAAPPAPGGPGPRGRGAPMVPGSFTILVVGR
jgi:DNA-binding beta-propeller fold protein YncE